MKELQAQQLSDARYLCRSFCCCSETAERAMRKHDVTASISRDWPSTPRCSFANNNHSPIDKTKICIHFMLAFFISLLRATYVPTKTGVGVTEIEIKMLYETRPRPKPKFKLEWFSVRAQLTVVAVRLVTFCILQCIFLPTSRFFLPVPVFNYGITHVLPMYYPCITHVLPKYHVFTMDVW